MLIKERMHAAGIKRVVLFKRRGPVLSFDLMHVQIIMQLNILGAMKIKKMIKKSGLKIKINTGGESEICKCIILQLFHHKM